MSTTSSCEVISFDRETSATLKGNFSYTKLFLRLLCIIICVINMVSVIVNWGWSSLYIYFTNWTFEVTGLQAILSLFLSLNTNAS